MGSVPGRHVRGAAVVGVLVVALVACSDQGDLGFVNEGPDDVVVTVDGEESEVSSGGGMLILDNGCTDGDVTVTFPAGEVAVVPGPVCPDQEIVIGDGDVDVRPIPDRG